MSLLSRTPCFVVGPDYRLHAVEELRFGQQIEALTTCGQHTVRLTDGASLYFVDDSTVAEDGPCQPCFRRTYT